MGFDLAISVSLNVFLELGQAVYNNADQENRWNDDMTVLTERFKRCQTASKAQCNQVNSDFACEVARKSLLDLNKNGKFTKTI